MKGRVGVSRYGAIILTLVISIGVWLVSWLGLLVPADGWLYDHLLRIRGQERPQAERVLLVDSGPRYWETSPEQWQEMVDRLNALGAAAVAFTFVPALSETFPANAETAGRLIIGLPPGDSVLADELRRRGIETAPLVPPPAEGGIHRGATALVEGEPGLALAAAQRLSALAAADYAAPLRVNFAAGPDWIPVVKLQRVQDAGLVQELVAGRVVLLGPVAGSQFAGLYTPVHQQDKPLALVEYQAYLIETLLLKNDIKTFAAYILLLLMLVVAAVSLITYQQLSFIMATRTTLAVLALYLLLGWLFLHYVALWLPLAELLLLQLLLFAAAIRHQQLAAEQQLQHSVARARSWLRGRAMPVGFYESPEHWAQVVNLVDQSLDLRRLIFLDRVADDHRVREVKALRCSIDDLDERRRDYERAPYSTAIEKGGPLQLDKAYLKELDGEAEIQYLVPLIYAGNITGFWAFGVAPERLEKRDTFELMVRRFANQIAELLYHRQQWMQDKRTEDRLVNRYLRLEAGARLRRQVGEALQSVERDRSMLDRAVHGLDTALVVYDVFGRVLLVNGAMESLVRRHRLPIYDMTALDLLTRVTEMNASQSRQALNYLTLQMKPMHIPVKLDGDDRQNYLLTAKPLSRDSGAGVAGEATAFDLAGLLFEILDVTAVSSLCGMKESLVIKNIWNMRNDLEAVQLGSELLQSEKIDTTRRVRAATIVSEKMRALGQLLNRMENDILASAQMMTREGYPLETLSRVRRILSELEPEAAGRSIRLVLNSPNFSPLVMAQPTEFAELVKNILRVLVNDAAGNSDINISVRVDSDTVHYSFTNSGFGLPDDDLQRFLFGAGHAVSEDFRVLRECIGTLQEWGGSMKAASEVGRGFEFEFSLPAVI